MVLNGDGSFFYRGANGIVLRGTLDLSSAGGTRGELLEAALEEHIYRVIAELFGKDEGYGAGRGGGMHIGDFSTGNLGANAIVGGSVPIATGVLILPVNNSDIAK